jgi:hypothetical protein
VLASDLGSSNQFNDFPEDDRKSAVPQDDDADVHNSMATVGDAVPAYRFVPWLDGDGIDALAIEEHFFSFKEKLTSPTTKRRWMIFHPNEVIVTPQSISSSPPFLFMGMQLIAKM